MKQILFLFLSIITFSCFSQGGFTITGKTEKVDRTTKKTSEAGNATIHILKDGQAYKSFKTAKDGSFESEKLDFGHNYKIIFSARNCIDMYILVDANVPAKYEKKPMGIGSNYIFYDERDKDVDSSIFKYPFMRVAFEGKEIKIDEKYSKDFRKGLVAEDVKNAVDQELLAEKEKRDRLAAELIEKQKKEAELAQQKSASNKIKIAGKLFTGTNPSKPVSNITLKLLNEKGEVVQTVITNFLGAFVFYISPEDEYSFIGGQSKDVSANAAVAFTNKNDKEIQSTIADNNGDFKFKIAKNDKNLISLIIVEDTELKMDLKGKLLSGDDPSNKPLMNVKINLMSPRAELVQTTTTNSAGSFSFTYLSASENYTIAVDENNPTLVNQKKVIFADANGKKIREVAGSKPSDFKFEVLPYEKNVMGEMYVDDPWLSLVNIKGANSFEKIITERVYFDVNDDKLLPDAKKTLDKIIAVLKENSSLILELSSHTDSQGADDYNLKLSEKRAKSAVDYLVANGVSNSRAKGKGYGETQLLNKCGNNSKCSEEEHAVNRRLEFKVVKK